MSEKKTVWYGERAGTPLGVLWAANSQQGLWAVSFDVSEEEFLEQVQERGPVEPRHEPQAVAAALDQLAEYLDGGRRQFDLPIDWSGMSDFQRAARQAVYDLPYGVISTYGEIADLLGKPGAARAVGRANATNPVPLVIPCHRVVGSDGKLHGYGGSGGLKTKAWLLELEGAYLV